MRKNVSKEQLDRYIEKLEKMINCKTVFVRDGHNDDEFKKFNEVVASNFPKLHERAEKMVFGTGCFFYKIEGTHPKKNVLLMSHHDVVAQTDGWTSDAFVAVQKDGCLYGRGTIDTKTPLFAELQAVEELIEEVWPFENLNVYIGSSNNEEVCGDGMVLATQYFKEQGLVFDVILDEGGAITTGMIPGYEGKSAMVAVHEKSRHMYKCETKIQTKGHGGLTPNKDDAITRLTKFMDEVNRSNIYKSQFYPEVKATFTSHAPHMKFPMSMVFSHLDLFTPIVKKIMMNIPQAAPMLSTSITFTSIFAGTKEDPQIKAKDAYCTMFVRCIREEDLNQGMAKIQEIAKKYGVEITLMERDYCEPSSFTSKEFQLVEDVLHTNFPDVVVAPFLLTAGTDARRFTDVAKNILRFAPIDLSKEQFASIHGDNENITMVNVGQCVLFYKDFLQRYGKDDQR